MRDMRGRNKGPLGPARGMARFINEVIAAATALSRGDWRYSAIPCRRRPQHHKCSGRLLVCNKSEGYIEWTCPRCNGGGVIHHWQGSLWDMTDVAKDGETPAFEVVVTEQEYDALRKRFASCFLHDRVIYGAAYTPEGIILRGTGEEFDDLAEDLALSMDSTRSERTRIILQEVLGRVEALLGKWSLD